MKTTFTVLIGLLFILFSCKTDEEKSNEGDAINFENLSSSELEDIGFKKIEDPATFEQGLKYLEEAAMNGSSEAAKEIGLRYARGNGVVQDKWKAMTYLKRAYDDGCTYELGRIYFEEASSQDDYKKAYECFSSLTFSSYYDNFGEYMLGYMNLHGLGTLKDYKAAYKYFDESTKRPNSDTLYGADLLGLGDAKYYLGMMAFEGLGCKKDFALAESYFDRGFMSNACKYMLGVMHYNGLCRRSSKKLAAQYIKQVYDLEGLNSFDREFSSKARQFWDDNELWRYYEENTINGIFN
jgi:TPR repeat protein